MQMDADAKLLADIPQGMPERVAEIFEPFNDRAWVRQHVDTPVSGLHGALHLGDNRFYRAHERNGR